MKIQRIKSPKYRVKRYVLNEYELRNLMLQVAKKEQPSNIVVTEIETGFKATILEDGSLDFVHNSFESLSLSTNFKFELLKLRTKETMLNLLQQ